jgi:hypothetical protein
LRQDACKEYDRNDFIASHGIVQVRRFSHLTQENDAEFVVISERFVSFFSQNVAKSEDFELPGSPE